jgi:hypothetical protein
VAETSESTRHGAPAGYLPNPPATTSVVDGVSVSTQRLLAGGDYAVGVRRAIAAPVLLDHPCLQHALQPLPRLTSYTRLPDVHISSKSYRRSGTASQSSLSFAFMQNIIAVPERKPMSGVHASVRFGSFGLVRRSSGREDGPSHQPTLYE